MICNGALREGVGIPDSSRIEAVGKTSLKVSATRHMSWASPRSNSGRRIVPDKLVKIVGVASPLVEQQRY